MGDLSFDKRNEPVSLVDGDTGDVAKVHPEGSQRVQLFAGDRDMGIGLSNFGVLKANPETVLFNENFPGNSLDTVDKWNQTITGSGTVTVAAARCVLEVTATSSTAKIVSKRLHQFIAGLSNIWRGAVKVSSVGVAGVKREWGAFTDTDGYLFRQDGAAFSVVIRRLGVETVVDSSQFLSPFVLGTTVVPCAIQYTSGNRVTFYVGGNIVWSATATTDTLIGLIDLQSMVSVVTTTASSTESIMVLGVNVLREGANLTFDDIGRLGVFLSAPTAPPNTTAVDNGGLITITANATVDSLYSITNGKTLTIQAFSVSASDGGTGKSVRVEMFEDPNGNLTVLNRVPGGTLFVNANSFERTIGRTFIGNGTRRILLRTVQLGAATMDVFRQWVGFEATTL